MVLLICRPFRALFWPFFLPRAKALGYSLPPFQGSGGDPFPWGFRFPGGLGTGSKLPGKTTTWKF